MSNIEFTTSQGARVVRAERSVLSSTASFIRIDDGSRYAAAHFTADETRKVIEALTATLPVVEPVPVGTFAHGEKVIVKEGAKSSVLYEGDAPIPSGLATVSFRGPDDDGDLGIETPDGFRYVYAADVTRVGELLYGHSFKVGDRVVIESNVLRSGNAGGLGSGIIGEMHTVTSIDNSTDGDSMLFAGYRLHPDAFLKVSDLDRLAVERAGVPPIDFAEGDLVEGEGMWLPGTHRGTVKGLGSTFRRGAGSSDRVRTVTAEGQARYLKTATVKKVVEPEPEPAPDFAVGDLVRVPFKANRVWHGVGRITDVYRTGVYSLTMLTGGRADYEGAFDAWQIEACEPLTETPSVGDEVVVIDNSGAKRDYKVGDVGRVETVRGSARGGAVTVHLSGHPAGMFPRRFTRA